MPKKSILEEPLDLIESAYKNNWTCKEIAEHFKISEHRASYIVNKLGYCNNELVEVNDLMVSDFSESNRKRMLWEIRGITDRIYSRVRSGRAAIKLTGYGDENLQKAKDFIMNLLEDYGFIALEEPMYYVVDSNIKSISFFLETMP